MEAKSAGSRNPRRQNFYGKFCRERFLGGRIWTNRDFLGGENFRKHFGRQKFMEKYSGRQNLGGEKLRKNKFQAADFRRQIFWAAKFWMSDQEA